MKVLKQTDNARMVVYGPPGNEAESVHRAAKEIRSRFSAGQRRMLTAARSGRIAFEGQRKVRAAD